MILLGEIDNGLGGMPDFDMDIVRNTGLLQLHCRVLKQLSTLRRVFILKLAHSLQRVLEQNFVNVYRLAHVQQMNMQRIRRKQLGHFPKRALRLLRPVQRYKYLSHNDSRFE
jgi:hypothetical protein